MNAVCLLLLSSTLGQARDVTVSAPTRLDWEFAVQGFGKGAAKLPGDFDSTKQKYQLFVPKGIKPKAWPLVVFISPGDGPTGLANWQKVCDKEGILFCSPYKAGNNVAAGQRTRIVLDVLDDVRRQFNVDPEQTYLSGFSGGGRMACAIGFALPEYFGGIAPVCGTNPISGPTYLRHRLQDRLSVAFITGEKDFNRKENEEYMFPYFQELTIRTRLWVAPKVGHQIPGADVMAEVYAWLRDDLPRRQKDATLRVAPEEGGLTAKRFLAAARENLKDTERVWRGVALVQGVVQRWPMSEAGKEARGLLKDITNDAKLLDLIGQQGAEDEQKSMAAQARGLEKFGMTAKAIEAWDVLAKNYADTPIGQQAENQIRRLQGKQPATTKLPPAFLGLGLSGNVIDQLAPKGPAETAGLKVGDVLLKIDSTKITGPQDLLGVMQGRKPGERIRAEILRDQQTLTITIEIGTRPKQ